MLKYVDNAVVVVVLSSEQKIPALKSLKLATCRFGGSTKLDRTVHKMEATAVFCFESYYFKIESDGMLTRLKKISETKLSHKKKMKITHGNWKQKLLVLGEAASALMIRHLPGK